MSERVGERAALAFFASNLHEQVTAGKIQDAEAAAACRMLDQAGYGRLPRRRDQRPAEPARLPAGGHLMTAGRQTDRHAAGGVRAAAAPRRRAARPARPRLPGPLRPLDGDPAAAVPGVGADRPRACRTPGTSRSTPAPSTSTPRRCSARARRSPPGRSSGGRSCAASASRCTRRSTPSTPSAGRSSTTSRSSESDDPVDRQLAVDRRLLEEPRMEAHGVREFPPDSLRGRFVRRALQAAVIDVILPAFTEQVLDAGGRRSAADPGPRRPRDRLPAGPHPLRDRRPRRPRRAAASCGARCSATTTSRALDDLYARVVWIPDGELERLDDAAREYRRIVGEPDPPPSAGGGRRNRAGPVKVGGEAIPAKDTAASTGDGAGAGSLADALEQAIASARADQLEQLDEDVDLEQVLARRGRAWRAGRQARTRARDRAADRPDARPRRRPAAVSRRGAARPPLRQPAAPGDHPRHPADRQAHPRRALRRPRLRPRPRRAGRRPAGHAPIRGGSPGRSRRRSRSRTSG